jgi:hypothetical protein
MKIPIKKVYEKALGKDTTFEHLERVLEKHCIDKVFWTLPMQLSDRENKQIAYLIRQAVGQMMEDMANTGDDTSDIFRWQAGKFTIVASMLREETITIKLYTVFLK